MRFRGEFEATVDAKGRFLLPGGLKKEVPEGERVFMVNRGFEKCLVLYPLKIWEGIEEKILKQNEFNPKVNQFRTLFVGSATEVEMDASGRFLIPPSLKEYAGITKDITLSGDIEKIKIWDSGKYKKIFEETSAEAFSALAMEIMGGQHT